MPTSLFRMSCRAQKTTQGLSQVRIMCIRLTSLPGDRVRHQHSPQSAPQANAAPCTLYLQYMAHAKVHASVVAKPSWLLIVNPMNSMKEFAPEYDHILTVRPGEEMRCLLFTKTGDIPTHTRRSLCVVINLRNLCLTSNAKRGTGLGHLGACDDEASSHVREAAAPRV